MKSLLTCGLMLSCGAIWSLLGNAQIVSDGSVAYWVPRFAVENQATPPEEIAPTMTIVEIGTSSQACTTDEQCGEPGEYITDIQCILQVRYFNPLQESPDEEYTANERLEEENWHWFVLNGVLAGFPLGKAYTWRQQTRYRDVPRCVSGTCAISREYRQKSCMYGCDVGGSEQCMCLVKDIGEAECNSAVGPHIYAWRQKYFMNSDGECESEYEVVFLCPAGYECSSQSGEAKCEKIYYNPDTGEVIPADAGG